MKILLKSIIFCLISMPVYALANPALITGGIGLTGFVNTPGNDLIISPFITDNFHHNKSQINPSFNLSVMQALPWSYKKLFSFMTLGPSLYYQKSSMSGDVWELNMQEFDNYTYNLTSENITLLLETYLNFKPISHALTPFINVGAGIGVASVVYDDHAKAGIPANTELHLNSHYNTNFAYGIGAGLSFPVNQKFAASLRYLYLHMGDVATSIVSYNNSNSHSMILSLTYLN